MSVNQASDAASPEFKKCSSRTLVPWATMPKSNRRSMTGMARYASTAALAARSNPWSKSAWAKTNLHPARESTTSRPSMKPSSTRIVLTTTAPQTPCSTTTPRHKRCWIKLKCLTWQVATRRTRKYSPKRWIVWRTILLDKDSILQPCGSSATALGKVTVLCRLWTPNPSLHTFGTR